MANPKPVTGFQDNKGAINLNGRPPKEFSITNALRELLSEHNPETKIERYKELLNKALTMAMRGDGDMLKYLINRIEGMPKGSETNVAVQINQYVGSRDQNQTIYEELERMGLCEECLVKVSKDLNL